MGRKKREGFANSTQTNKLALALGGNLVGGRSKCVDGRGQKSTFHVLKRGFRRGIAGAVSGGGLFLHVFGEQTGKRGACKVGRGNIWVWQREPGEGGLGKLAKIKPATRKTISIDAIQGLGKALKNK